MRGKWSGLGLWVVPWLAVRVSGPSVRLETGQGAPIRVSSDFDGRMPPMLAIIASAGFLLVGCAATTSESSRPGSNNGGSFLFDGVSNTNNNTRFGARHAQYIHTPASTSELCLGAWTSVVSTVTFQRAPNGSLTWGFRLSNQARALLGPVVTVTMPFSYVNGQAINPPYGPHMGENTYNFHGSLNIYQFIGGGGGSLQTGDKVTFYWNIQGPTDMAAFRYITCKVPLAGSG